MKIKIFSLIHKKTIVKIDKLDKYILKNQYFSIQNPSHSIQIASQLSEMFHKELLSYPLEQ